MPIFSAGIAAANKSFPEVLQNAATPSKNMAVLEQPLKNGYEEIDLVTTPADKLVAIVHSNNYTNGTNAWASVLKETAQLMGADVDDGTLFTRLYEKSLERDPDCGGILVCISGNHYVGNLRNMSVEEEAGFGRINKPKYCWCEKGVRPGVPCHHIREYYSKKRSLASPVGNEMLGCLIKIQYKNQITIE